MIGSLHTFCVAPRLQKFPFHLLLSDCAADRELRTQGHSKCNFGSMCGCSSMQVWFWTCSAGGGCLTIVEVQVTKVKKDEGLQAVEEAAEEEEILPELQAQDLRVHRVTSALPNPALESILPQTCSANTTAASTL